MKRKRFKKWMAVVLAFVLLQNNMVVYASSEAEAQETSEEIQEVIPAPKSEESEVKSEEPEVKPEEPEMKLEEPEMKPEEPEVKPEEPEVKAEEPEVKPEEPEVKAEEPEAKPEEPASEEKTDLEQPEEDASSQEEKWIVSFDENADLYGQIYVEGEPILADTFTKEINNLEAFSFVIEAVEGYEVAVVKAEELEIAKAEEAAEYTIGSVEKDTVISVTYEEVMMEDQEEVVDMVAEQKAPVMKSISAGAEEGKEILNVGRNGETSGTKETLKYLSWNGSPVGNTIKYVDTDADKNADTGERLAYCVNYDREFKNEHLYSGSTWIDENSKYKEAYQKMYSELAYIISIGAQTYGNNASEGHSTGNWKEDYYITQEVIYIVIDDWVNGKNNVFEGLNLTDAQITELKKEIGTLLGGHSTENLAVNSADSWTANGTGDKILAGVNDMYEAVKEYRADRTDAGDSDGYDAFLRISPKPTEAVYNVETGNYEFEFAIRTTGKIVGQIQVGYDGPDGTISNLGSGRYKISIPAMNVTSDSTFRVWAAADFQQIKTDVYLADDGKQNILFYSENKARTIKKQDEFDVGLNEVTVELEVQKVDEETEALIDGAVFDVYTSEACDEKITTIEVKNGTASISGLHVTLETVWLKEVKAPAGYILDSTPIEVALSESQNSVTVTNTKNDLTISKKDIADDNGELKGAKLQVVYKDTKEVATTIDGEVLSWTTGDEPKAILGLRDGAYILQEVEAPAGYTIADDIEFTVVNGNIYCDEEIVKSIAMFDRKTEVAFAKVDEAGNYLADAVLAVYKVNEDDTLGVLVERWTTIDDIHMIFGLEAGNYRLIEESAPSGYVTAWAIDFEVDNLLREEPVVIEMTNCHTRVQITKQFETVDGKEYQMKAGDEVVFEILTADTKEIMAHALLTAENPVAEIAGLPVGSYILREVKAPAGFTLAADVTFTITDEMEDVETVKVHEVSVVNTATTVEVHKVDGENLELLKGAKMQILDKATGLVATTVYGEKLEWITDGSVKVIRGLAAGEYILHEAEAPEGYELAEDISFTVTEDAAENVVVMKDMKIEVVTKSVKTGDATPLAMWSILMMMSLVCLIAIVRKRYK